jgi:peptidoglycan/xylan/chitin deacetylase (PgdA/CDA1 family)
MLLTIAAIAAVPGCASAPATQAETAKPAKLCALTFDDGPDADKTALVLDRLEKYHVVASFFMVGQLINDDTKPVIDRMVKLNCEVNNHSWAWESMNQMTPEQIKDSVSKTSAAIKQYTGKDPKFFRPPNLATSETLYANVGLPFAQGVLGMDWAGCGTSAEDRANNVLKNVKDGAIILLHDVQPYPHPTPEALDILIPELQKQGYEFVTVSELFRRKGVTPDPKEETMWTYVEKE